MINYSAEWKKKTNIRQISYEDFVTFQDVNGIYMQKLDGMLGTFIYRKGKQNFFQTTSGHEIGNIPVVDEYNTVLDTLGFESIIIPGELIAKRNGKILPFNETMSIVKTSYKPQNRDLVYHYPVDVYRLNGNAVPFNYALKLIARFAKGKKHIELPKIVSGNLDVFRKLYKDTMVPGYDGVVVRDLYGKNYKVKFISTVDLVVIGAGNTNMRAWPKNEISYLLTAFIDKDGLFRTSSKIGTGYTTAIRRYFFDLIMKNKIFERKGDFYIKPELMVEVKFYRSRITPMPSLIYTGRDYIESKDLKSITFAHPTFIRERRDKIPNKQDARLEQIPEWRY